MLAAAAVGVGEMVVAVAGVVETDEWVWERLSLRQRCWLDAKG
jgi:hypothetical protein